MSVGRHCGFQWICCTVLGLWFVHDLGSLYILVRKIVDYKKSGHVLFLVYLHQIFWINDDHWNVKIITVMATQGCNLNLWTFPVIQISFLKKWFLNVTELKFGWAFSHIILFPLYTRSIFRNILWLIIFIMILIREDTNHFLFSIFVTDGGLL